MEFSNANADAYPIHVHEVAFEVVDLQATFVDRGAILLATSGCRTLAAP